MRRYTLFLGLLATLMLASCDKNIEFSGEITEPLMVLNALTTPDSILTVKVTESHFFLSSTDTFATVKDAVVLLTVNGTFSEQMRHVSNGVYRGTYKTTAGDHVRLVVTAPGLPSVETDLIITEKVHLVGIDTTLSEVESYPIYNYENYYGDGWVDYPTTPDTIGWQYYAKVNVAMTFRDPAAEANYYRLIIIQRSYYNDSIYSDYAVWYDKSDMVFDEDNSLSTDLFNEGTFNYFGIFSDVLIDGKDYPLKFDLSSYYETYFPEYADSAGSAHKEEFYVDLQSISKSYYLYLKTWSAYSGDDLFSEPVQIYSNIKGGIGLLGNYTSNVTKLTF
jgi:hypothetical protein